MISFTGHVSETAQSLVRVLGIIRNVTKVFTTKFSYIGDFPGSKGLPPRWLCCVGGPCGASMLSPKDSLDRNRPQLSEKRKCIQFQVQGSLF